MPRSNRPVEHSSLTRTAVVVAGYAAILAACFYAAYELRFDFLVEPEFQRERLLLLPAVVLLKVAALVLARQTGVLLTYFSIPDLVRLFWAMLASSLVLVVPRLLLTPAFHIPRGVVLVDFLLSFGALCSVRIALRLYRERLNGGRKAGLAGPEQRIAIVGAGDAGAALAKEFINYPARGFRPVCFLDDNPSKHGQLIHGVPVIGRPEALPNFREVGSLAKVIIAMPSAPAKRIRDVVALCGTLNLKVETLPSMEQLASGRIRTQQIRPVEVQDLLGREAINLDHTALRQAVEGRVVLVTGAGGSIGSELCRQLAALHPRRLVLVDQSEPALFLIEQELNEAGRGGNAVPLVADILDRDRISWILGRYRPDVVFHAAAHKHVFLMERQPAEAIRNNVFGTRQLAELAVHHGVGAFVLISTDKAINPTNVMGATKRLAELQLMALANGGGGPTKFMAVRFGNVLGSSGSVIPIFKRQIAQGGPVTVTHPEVMRYFMTIPEACGLVLQSFVQGRGGEIFVLDMGQPVKIVDLARQMVELSGFRVGEDIEITFSGLKPGEKLFEELQHHSEEHVPTEHPRIMRFVSRAQAAADDLRVFEGPLHDLEPNELKRRLQRLVPEYTPHFD